MTAVPSPYSHLSRRLLELGWENELSGGNSFEIITSGLRKRELLLRDIASARSFIHMEYFRFGNDKAGKEVRDLLEKKVAEGVEVRLLNNNMSAWLSIPASYFKSMTHAGIEVIPFTHIRHGLRKWLFRINHQQHRKVVIIDGRIAYTGGMNLNDNYFYRWRDTHLRITGDAVASLNASFLESWRESGGRPAYPPPHYFPGPRIAEPAPFMGKTLQLVSDSPETKGSSMLQAYLWILHHARDYVYIQTPYLAPPPILVQALKEAAGRGVDVRLMLPRKMDTPLVGPVNHSFYTELLEAGIRLEERGGNFMHCKTLVADDGVSVIGASNLDWRSFYLNYEINVLVYDRETALYCRQLFLDEMPSVKQLQLQEWKQEYRGGKKLLSIFLRLFYKLF